MRFLHWSSCLLCPASNIGLAFCEFPGDLVQKTRFVTPSLSGKLPQPFVYALPRLLPPKCSCEEPSVLCFPGENVVSRSLWQSTNTQLYFGTQLCTLLTDHQGLIMTKNLFLAQFISFHFPWKLQTLVVSDPRLKHCKATSHLSFLPGSFLFYIQLPLPFHM
jgi:hypothetical protein